MEDDPKIINKYLERFGKNIFGQPVFRLTWTTDQIEKRYGTYNEFYGKIFVRTITGCIDRPKYPHIADRWIIEQWYPPEKTYDPDIPATKEGDYLCIYVFEDSKRNKLDLKMRVVEIIMHSLMRPDRSRMKIASDIKSEVENKDRKEIEYFEDAIDTSPLQNALHMREARGYEKELKDAPEFKSK